MYAATLLVCLAMQPWSYMAAQLPEVLLYPLMLQSWLPVDVSTAFPRAIHTWSISTEIFFYLCFPAIALALSLIGTRAHLLALCLAVPVLSYLALYGLYAGTAAVAEALPRDTRPLPFTVWMSYIAPYTRVFEFLSGCVAARAFMLLRNSYPSRSEVILVVLGATFVGAIFIVLRIAVWPSGFYGFIEKNYAFAPITTLLIFMVARYSSPATALLSRPLVVQGGEISYSIYLLHVIVIPYFVAPEPHTLGVASFAQWLVRFSVAFGFVAVFAWGTYTLIEVPGRRYLRALLGAAASREAGRPLASGQARQVA
jgi:peptidoglycan/LPS O-acetylase OafA/YrhL